MVVSMARQTEDLSNELALAKMSPNIIKQQENNSNKKKTAKKICCHDLCLCAPTAAGMQNKDTHTHTHTHTSHHPQFRRDCDDKQHTSLP